MGEILDLLLRQIGGVGSHREMHWQRCSRGWVHICNHVEIEELWTILLHDDLVDQGARAGVAVVSVHLLEQSGRHVGVDEHVEDLRVVIWCEASDRVLDLTNLLLQALLLQRWATDTVSVHNDQAWLLALISLGVSHEGFSEEILEDFRSVNGNLVFLLILGHVIFRSLLHSAFVQILVHNFGVVLGQIARVGGGEAEDRLSALINDIDAEDHGVQVLYLLTDVDSI
jgi:hypothetical protein